MPVIYTNPQRQQQGWMPRPLSSQYLFYLIPKSKPFELWSMGGHSIGDYSYDTSSPGEQVVIAPVNGVYQYEKRKTKGNKNIGLSFTITAPQVMISAIDRAIACNECFDAVLIYDCADHCSRHFYKLSNIVLDEGQRQGAVLGVGTDSTSGNLTYGVSASAERLTYPLQNRPRELAADNNAYVRAGMALGERIYVGQDTVSEYAILSREGQADIELYISYATDFLIYENLAVIAIADDPDPSLSTNGALIAVFDTDSGWRDSGVTVPVHRLVQSGKRLYGIGNGVIVWTWKDPRRFGWQSIASSLLTTDIQIFDAINTPSGIYIGGWDDAAGEGFLWQLRFGEISDMTNMIGTPANPVQAVFMHNDHLVIGSGSFIYYENDGGFISYELDGTNVVSIVGDDDMVYIATVGNNIYHISPLTMFEPQLFASQDFDGIAYAEGQIIGWTATGERFYITGCQPDNVFCEDTFDTSIFDTLATLPTASYLTDDSGNRLLDDSGNRLYEGI